MPESLNVDDLGRFRQPRPTPPYVIHPWDYSYFMGDKADEGLKRNRKLVKAGRLDPIINGRPASQRKGEVWSDYNEPDIDNGSFSEEGFPFQSYYYMMDYDQKGPVAVKEPTAYDYRVVARDKKTGKVLVMLMTQEEINRINGSKLELLKTEPLR